jgi:hypothetical protein
MATSQVRKGFRDPEEVQAILLRMGTPFVDSLDRLCGVNQRSRREIVEILVAEADAELEDDPDARINPL